MFAQSDEEPTVEVSFVDSSSAPDVFADDTAGYFFRNGVISITFWSARVDHSTSPGPVNRVVVGRLVMPVVGAQNLAIGLYDFLAKRGMAPNIDPKKSN